MKIDDPRVQDYIKGQLNSEEEAALFVEFENYPEVADLAETLKRTQALISEDIQQGTVPEIARQSSKASGLEKTFEPMLGKNWRVELALLSGGLAVLLLILIGVPLIKDLQKRAKDDASANQFGESLESEAKGFSGSSAKVIHEAQSESQIKGYSGPDQRLDYEALIVGADRAFVRDAESHFVKLTKQMSTMPAKAKQLVLPVQVDVDLGYEMRQSLKSGQILEPKSVGPIELMNSFEPSASNSIGREVRLTASVETAPWDPELNVMSLSLEVNPDLRKANEKNTSRAFVFLGASDAIKKKLSEDSVDPISTDLKQASSQLTAGSRGESLHMVVFLWRALSSRESFLLNRWLKKQGTRLSIVDTTAAQRARVRKEVGPEKDLVYLSAPTPVLLKKAFYNYQAGNGDPIQRVQLTTAASGPSVKDLRGPLSGPVAKTEGLPLHNWLFAGERVSSVVTFNSDMPQAGDLSVLLSSQVVYRKDHDEPQMKSETADLTAMSFMSDKINLSHIQIISLTWLGQILKGQRPLTEVEFDKLKAYAAPLAETEVGALIWSTEKLYF
jgi:hypothetical protein